MKIRTGSRTLVTLMDKNGKVIKRHTIPKSIRACADKLGLAVPTDPTDKIIIESEGKQ